MVVAGVIGAVVGACRRPHGAHLATPVLVLPGVVVIGVGLQVAIGVFALPAEPQLFGAALALSAGFAVVNRHLVGMGLLAVGLVLNLTAVLVHGGMPVRPSALVEAGAVDDTALADTDLGAGRRFERRSDVAPILGDVIPVAPFGAAMSFGDLVALVGIGSLSGELVRYARRGSRWSLIGAHARAGRDTARRSGGLAAEVVGETGVGGEEIGAGDVVGDREVLHDTGHVVDAQQRVWR